MRHDRRAASAMKCACGSCNGIAPGGDTQTDTTRCSEQSRRKTVTQSYGTTASEIAMSAEPPANSPTLAVFFFRGLEVNDLQTQVVLPTGHDPGCRFGRHPRADFL